MSTYRTPASFQSFAAVPKALPGQPEDYGQVSPALPARVAVDDLFRWWYRASALQISWSFSYLLETTPAVQVTASGSAVVPRNGVGYSPPAPGENPDTPTRIDILRGYDFYEAGPFVAGDFIETTYSPQGGSPYTQNENFGAGTGDGPFNSRGFLTRDGFYLLTGFAPSLGSYPGNISGSLFGAPFQTSASLPSNVKNASATLNISFSGGDLPLF